MSYMSLLCYRILSNKLLSKKVSLWMVMVFQLVIGCSSVIAMIILRVLRTRVYSVVKCARPHNDLIGHQLWSLLILQLFDVVPS